MLLAGSAFALYGVFGRDDAGVSAGREPQATATAQAYPGRAGRTLSSAYRRAFVNGVPPKFDFVEHWSAPLFARGMARGDFNGDGRDDLALIGGAADETEYASRVFLYLQTEAGTFTAPEIVETPRVVLSIEVAGLAAGDLNEDGKDDLVVTTWSQGVGLMAMLSAPAGGHLWREDAWNNGMPSHAPPQLADQDGDGHLDVLLAMVDRERDLDDPESSQLATWFGDGQGRFPRHAGIETVHYDPGLVLAQLDGAGPLDVLSVGDADLAPAVHRGDGAGGWLAPVVLPPPEADGGLYWSYYSAGSALDVDGDGRQDAVLSLWGVHPRLAIYLQQSDGTLSSQQIQLAGGGVGILDRAADLDGNGLTDLVQVDRSAWQPGFTYLLHDAYGLDVPVGQPVDGAPWGDYAPMALAIGDFNDDGITDIAISSDRDGVRVWRGRLTPYQGEGGLPAAPTVLHAEADPDPLEGEAVVTLAAAADGGSPVTGYTVYPNPGGGIDVDAGSAALVHRVEGLVPGQQYMFRARATNAAGKGPPSAFAAAVTIPAFQPELHVSVEGLVEEPDFGDAIVYVRPSLDLPAPPGGVSFVISTQDGSAHAGSDYEALPPTLVTIPAGEFSAPLMELTVHGDLDIEGDEDLQLVLSNVVGAKLAMGATVTLHEYDADALRFGNRVVRPVEGDNGKSRVQIPLLLPAPATTDVVVYLAAETPWWWEQSNVPVAGVDYELPVTQVVIPAGQSMVSVPFDIIGDGVRENGEMVGLFASFVPFPVHGGPSPAITLVLIGDNDPLPLLSLAPVVVQEGDDDIVVAHFKATLSGTQPDDAWFSFETAGGSAASGADFADTRRSGLVIRAGQTELDIPVLVQGDRLAEGSETFTARLTSPYQTSFGSAQATGTILDDDPGTGISVTGVTQAEGNGAGVARFLVELASPQPTPVSFDLRTSDGTAFAGSDYSAVSLADLVIPAGETRLWVDVPVLGDSVPEATETFGLEITRATGATPVRARALARLLNDDLPVISVSDASVVEGTGPDGTRAMRFILSLSSPATQPVAFWLKVRSTGSATAWADMADNYQAPPIDPGRTRVTIDLPIYADDIAEPDETFELAISAVHGATIGDGVGIGTIIDDDAPTVTTAPARRTTPGSPGGRMTGLGVRPGTRAADTRQ